MHVDILHSSSDAWSDAGAERCYSFLYNNEHFVSGKRSKNIYLFYCDSYYAWMRLLKMSHNWVHFNGVIVEIITAINLADQTGCFLETAIISNDQTGCKR